MSLPDEPPYIQELREWSIDGSKNAIVLDYIDALRRAAESARAEGWNAAMEEAAKVCDAQAQLLGNRATEAQKRGDETLMHKINTAWHVITNTAAAIRSLKEKS